MPSKFAKTPAGLKAPPVCRKPPPPGIPTRLPRGTLRVAYTYRLQREDISPIDNSGSLPLYTTDNIFWQSHNADPPLGVPYIFFTVWPSTALVDIGFTVHLTDPWHAEWGRVDIPCPGKAPFRIVTSLDYEGIIVYDLTGCRIEINPY